MKHISKKWSILENYPIKSIVLTESKFLLAEGLLSNAWNGLVGLAKSAGKKMIDYAVWIAKFSKKVSAIALKTLKALAKKIQGVIVSAIQALPGGPIVLEFLSEYAGKLNEKIKEMRDAIGEKVKKFVDTAKQKIFDFFFKYVLTDEELKVDLYKEMGLTLDQVKAVANESKRLKGKIIKEITVPDDVTSKIKEKTGIANAEELAKAVGAIENKGPDAVDPQKVLRQKAGDIVGKLIDFWAEKVVPKNPKKYFEPLFNSGFFSQFGENGFMLASASILGILASSKLDWKELVRFVTSLVRGFKSGTDRPEGAKTNKAGAFLFLGNKSNNYDSSLFKNFITGVINGSNMEVIIRAMIGDVTQIGELTKRLISSIINGVKGSINDKIKLAVQAEGPINDEDEEQVNDVIGNYVDNMFGSGESN